jgi:alkylation response protein AidB-like acyl-CoA dehydrogenase
MNLSLDADDHAVVDAVRASLADRLPAGVWSAPGADILALERDAAGLAARLGWIGAGCDERIGGSAQGIIQETLIQIECGRGLAPVSIAAGMVAAYAAEHAGAPDLARQLIDGRAIAALAVPQRSGWAALAGGAADLAVEADGSGLRLHQISHSILSPGFDAAASVALLPDGPNALLSCAGAYHHHRLQLLLAGYLVGMAEAVLAQSVSYATLRVQFGRPIGAFQGVSHRCADMAMRCARARAGVLYAAAARAGDARDTDVARHAAVVLASEAARENARANIFIHGAMGVTAENAAHLYLRRALVLIEALGGWSAMRERAAHGHDGDPEEDTP